MPSYPSCSIRGARGAGWQPEGEAGGPGPSETKQRPGRAPLIFPVQHPHARRTAILRFTACSARPRPPERGPTPSYGGAADGTAHSSRGTPDGPGSSLSVLRAVPVGAQWAGAPGHRARVRYLFSLHARLSAAARKGGPSSAHHGAVAGSPGHHHPLPVSPDPSIPPVASSLASQQRPGSSRAERDGWGLVFFAKGNKRLGCRLGGWGCDQAPTATAPAWTSGAASDGRLSPCPHRARENTFLIETHLYIYIYVCVYISVALASVSSPSGVLYR